MLHRIIVRCSSKERWIASFGDNPLDVREGACPSAAIRRLVETHPERKLVLNSLKGRDVSSGQLEFTALGRVDFGA